MISILWTGYHFPLIFHFVSLKCKLKTYLHSCYLPHYSKMMMLQTTNPILNHALYNQSTTQSLLAWHRVRLANWLASNGWDWAEYIKEYNSGNLWLTLYFEVTWVFLYLGTYNNQYMVLDLKLVNLTNEIKDNALWVVEQIPGWVCFLIKIEKSKKKKKNRPMWGSNPRPWD